MTPTVSTFHLYDVFISYSHADSRWVQGWLLPHLQAVGLCVCIDFQNFDVGVPSIINMERAIDYSRHTLLVLTPDWVASEWRELEVLLIQSIDPAARQRRMIPILLRPCEPPRRIAMLTYADFTQVEQQNVQLQRVIAAVTGKLHLPDVGPQLRRLLSQELDSQAERNRSRMLSKVRTIWITGLLENSLAHEARITLNLVEKLDAVILPLNVQVQELNHPPRDLPPGIPIIQVFDNFVEELLILGAPGSGKTTLLLELARDLISRAELEISHPIPVIFNLSSWSAKYLSLEYWLIDELAKVYDVPPTLGQVWVELDQILPLLDGLDEVRQDHRAECIKEINAFRLVHGLCSLVVSSRTADYESLSSRLKLQGAVLIEPLSPEQVLTYLSNGGDQLAALLEAIKRDSLLSELAESPLMLGIMTLAYQGRSIETLPVSRNIDEGRKQLFAMYVERMFIRRSSNKNFSRQQTMHWLIFLARMLTRHSHTVFFVEHIQPASLLTKRQIKIYVVIVGLIHCLAYGMMMGFLLGLIIRLSGLPGGFGVGLFLGLIMGLYVTVSGGMITVNQLRQIQLVEKIGWSWYEAKRNIVNGSIFGLIIGPFLGMSVSLASTVGGVPMAPITGIIMGVVGSETIILLVGIISGLNHRQVEMTHAPNQGILSSALNAAAIGLGTFLSFSLISGISMGLVSGRNWGVIGGLTIGSIAGLIATMSFGGLAVIQHYVLRLIFQWQDYMPWHITLFLDYCTERIFLRKVGGGYIFIHRLLMEYFASLDISEPGKR
ncbi:MAG TPA: TIR domain-containing protein [Herpetosiphonaceae bacterium]